MRRKTLILASTCGLLLPLAACERTERQTADERAEVRQEAREIGQEARQGGENVAQEVRETNKQIGQAAEKAVDDRYERFEAYENESSETFASRADAAIQRLETDLQQVRQKATSDDANEAVQDAQEAINEAKKDLADVRGKTGVVIDDGRMGVAMNINQAQRKLTDVYDQMSEAKM